MEHFHRQLKTALLAPLHPSWWSNSLTLVMLSTRSNVKADVGCVACGSSLPHIPPRSSAVPDDTLPPSNDFSHLLSCVDRLVKTIPLPNMEVDIIVKVFVSRWITIFGVPSTISTDRACLNFVGCTRIRTTAYHRAANGRVERFHRQLNIALRAAQNAAD
ncbi:unnamed protein product [Dibothriocephalus latus]|uniref:Integrase catalytic domain-containing protein n=1 Tax=Dibothriocephalus latus TaxID=60516 RepID=A0A3P7LXE4_DIBLA|nr:unnamed protein product [Dibothriocephalus latus]